MKLLTTFLITLCVGSLQAQQFTWGKSIGGTSTDNAQRLAQDSSGNIFVAGTYTGAVLTSAGTLPAYGFQDVFIAKYSPNGTLLWQKGIGGANNDQITAIACDTAGNVWVAGRFQGSIDLNPGDSVSTVTSDPANALEGYFIQLDGTTGDLVDYRDITAGGTIDIRVIRIDEFNNKFIGGQYTQTVNFDLNGGTYSKTSNVFSGDCFIGKYNDALQLTWMNVVGSQTPAIDFISDFCLGADGFLYCTGMIGGTADINPSASTTNLVSAVDAFLIRYAQNDGSLSWGFLIGGSSLELGNCVMLTEEGNIVVTGSMNSASMDVDPGVATSTLTKTGTNACPFVARYTASANLVSAVLMQGSAALTANVNRIWPGIDNTIMMAGNYKGDVDIELGDAAYSISSGDSTNAFVLRYAADWSLMNYFELGGTGDQTGNDLTTEGTNVYICGQMSNTLYPEFPATLNVLPRASLTTDGYLVKYNLVPDALVNAETHTNTLHVYPNPSNGLFYLQNANAANTAVYDVSGRKMNCTISNGCIQLEAAKGMYVVVQNENGRNHYARIINN
ncbi:MAG: hypothetical protein RLZZ543_2075 [Bacteroidota bacterium]